MLLAHRKTFQSFERGDSTETIALSWQPGLAAFEARRKPFLLY
jgi:hypothetical protein